jgi:hypothetical protein
MKLIALVILAALSTRTYAQEAQPWYETNEHIALLHGPRGQFRARISPEWINYIFASNPVTMTRICSQRPPIAFQVQPTPELASFITSPSQHITAEQFEKLTLQADRWLQVLNDDADNFIQDLHAYGFSFLPASETDRANATKLLAGFASIGRVFAVRMVLPMNAFAVNGLKLHDTKLDAATPSTHIALIDIQHPNENSLSRFAIQLPPQQHGSIHAHSIMFAYVEQMGHAFWRQMPQEQRTSFITQFGFEHEGPDEIKLLAEHAFADAFVIAVLYPTTFETEQVEPFQIFGLTSPTPPTGEFLEQIRFVDNLLDPIEEEFHSRVTKNVAKTSE